MVERLLLVICGTQFDHRFPFPFSQFLELRCTEAAVVDDVGDDEIRLVDHPPVLIGDRETLRRGLDALRKDSVEIVGGIELASLLRHIREHNAVSDWVLG